MDKLAKKQASTTLEAVRGWASLPEDELKRKASVAARDKDVATLWSITEAHLTLDRTYSKHTLTAYERNVKRLVEAWSHVNLLRPARDDGRLYRLALEGEGLKPSSVQQALSAAKVLYAALRWARATDATPFTDVKAQKDPVPQHEKRQAYSLEALAKLYQAATDPTMRVEPTTSLMLSLGALAALRVSEMLGLRWSDIDLDACELVVRHGKGNKQRTVPLHSDLAKELAALEGDSDALIFGGVTPHALRDRMRRLCDRAGVRYLGIHALRHSAATMMRDGGKALDDISKVLGHESIATTAIYAKMDKKRLSDAVTSIPSVRRGLIEK